MDTTNEPEVGAALSVDETESASSVSEELEAEEPSALPPNRMKMEALRRLKALERRGKTVGTHLDELRELLTLLFEQLPD